METVSIDTTQNIRINYKLAGVLDRILAFLLDAVILFSYTSIVSLVAGAFDAQSTTLSLINAAVVWLYFLVSEIAMNGQTLGKKAQKLRVVKVDGSKPGLGAYLLRWVLWPVDMFMSGGIAIASITLTKKGQRLGDLLAGTTVIHDYSKNFSLEDQEKTFKQVDENYTPKYPEAAQLTEEEVKLIRSAVTAFVENGNRQPLLLLQQKMKAKLNITSEEPELRFLNNLVRDYTYYATRTAEAAL